nr:proteasome subunit beta type-5-like [Tanacetum cinerariifolium]
MPACRAKEIQTQQTLMQTLRDLPVTSNPSKGTTSVAFIFEGDVMVVDDSRASMGSYICQMLKMAVRRFSYRLSECGKEWVGDFQLAQRLAMKSGAESHLSTGTQFTTYIPVCGDSVQQECYRPLDMAAYMDMHADVIEVDWIYYGKLRNRVVKEGDASSLLVTSSSNVIVSSDDGISQEDPTHYANAVSGVPDPVCLGVPPCFT